MRSAFFYTGIAMSVIAAEAAATTIENETSLDTDTMSTAASWTGDFELSQVGSELERGAFGRRKKKKTTSKGMLANASKAMGKMGKATGMTKSKKPKR